MTRMAIATRPTRRKTMYALLQGEGGRRDATTKAVALRSSNSTIGLVVRLAAIATAVAHPHHAAGWSSRGCRADDVTTSPDVGIATTRRHREAQRRRRLRGPATRCCHR